MYPGGKGNCYQRIINLQRPHDTYIEAFLGGGSVLKTKKPAYLNIGIDVDPKVIANFDGDCGHLHLWRGNAIKILRDLDFSTLGRVLVYADPPYLMSTRSSQRQLYRYELGTPEEHQELLGTLKALPCDVQISGYDSELYREELDEWNFITFQAVTRGGTLADEFLWYNYPEPDALHDYRYLGDDYRERERIRRKLKRHVEGLKRLNQLERLAVLDALQSAFVDTAVFDVTADD